MPVSDAVDWLRQEVQRDLDSVREDPIWWATARTVGEAWFGVALLLRQTVHNLVYGAVADDPAPDRETTLRYSECHVVDAGEETAHRCRFWTAMTGVFVAGAISPILAVGQQPVVGLLLVSNWGLLVADPLAPLITSAVRLVKP